MMHFVKFKLRDDKVIAFAAYHVVAVTRPTFASGSSVAGTKIYVVGREDPWIVQENPEDVMAELDAALAR